MVFKIKKEFVEDIRNLVKQDKIVLERDGAYDTFIKNAIQEKTIKEAFFEGMIIEDSDLYPENPDKKHIGKNYYCIYKYTVDIIFSRTLLISFVVKNSVIIFHVSHINYGSREERCYRNNIKKFKESCP